MRKIEIKSLVILCYVLVIVSVVIAQDNPTVEIVLSQPVAEQGDTITVDVSISGAQNVGGADVGITVDTTCLRIVDRQPGNYLPTTEAEGAFTPFTEVNEHDTRWAVALTNRSQAASGSGVFYTVQVEVLCDEGTAPLNVSYAKLSTYEDPSAESVSLISYSLEEGTLNVANAELAMAPAGQVTLVPTNSPEPTVAVEQPTSTDSTIATLTPSATIDSPVETETEQESNDQLVLMIVIGLLVGVIVVLLVLVFWLWRRSRDQQTQ